MYRPSSPLRAELSALYGPSCPLRAELSTGRVVHGPSCPGIRSTLYFAIVVETKTGFRNGTVTEIRNLGFHSFSAKMKSQRIADVAKDLHGRQM